MFFRRRRRNRTKQACCSDTVATIDDSITSNEFKPRVRFASTKEVTLCLSRRDMSKEEIQNSWYSSKQCFSMRNHCDKDIPKRGRLRKQPLSDATATLNLKHADHSKRYQERREWVVGRAHDAVLSRQAFLQFLNDWSDEEIAEEYRRHTTLPAVEAIRRAKRLEEHLKAVDQDSVQLCCTGRSGLK